MKSGMGGQLVFRQQLDKVRPAGGSDPRKRWSVGDTGPAAGPPQGRPSPLGGAATRAAVERGGHTHSRWYGWPALIDQARYSCSISSTRARACGKVRSDRRMRW